MYKARVLSLCLVAVFVLSCLASTAAAQGIGGVTVKASPDTYNGPCPAKIRFTGVIEVLHRPMTLNYHWERSDGAKGPVKVFHVTGNTRTITTVEMWQLNTPGREQITATLHVNSGNDHLSSSATVRATCR